MATWRASPIWRCRCRQAGFRQALCFSSPARSLAAILLAGVAGAVLARRISKPLVHLAEAAHAVSAGDLGSTVSTESDITELRSLGAAFNSMTVALRQSDQAKTAFLADVTHELRTPADRDQGND